MAFRNLAVLACMFTCAASAFARAEFASLAQAQAAFATGDPADRERAYRYVLDAAGAADGRNASAWLQVLRTMAVALGRVSEYDAVCERGFSSPDEAVRFASLMALALSPSASRAPEDFVSRLEGAARGGVALDVAHRIEALKTAAAFRTARLMDGRGAGALLDEAIGLAGEDAARVLLLRQRKVEAFVAARMDAETEREATSLLQADGCPVVAYAFAAYVLADLEARRGNAEKAGELILSLIRKGGAQTPQGVARRLFEVNAGDACLSNAVDALRRGLAHMPLGDAAAFRAAVERIQPEVVDLLNRLGRCDEALAECRVLVLLSSPKSYQAAVNLTAASLKRADGNLGRATAFMNFQKKGFVPKERNILLDAPQLSDGVRAEARKSLPVGKSEVWGESLAVSARLIWLDDPVAAVREAMRAFGLAPFDNKSLQICADAIMQPILTVTRNPDSAKGIVDYLMYGPNGPDGAKGTQDDLSSPFENIEPVLKLGHGN